MRKRILLIAPYIHDFAAYDLWLKPLGLLYVAAHAEAAGHDVRIVNCLDRLHPAACTVRQARGQARTYGGGRGKFSFETIPKPACLAHIPREYKRYGIPITAFRRELAEGPPPDVVGIGSMMTYWCGGLAETVRLVRETFPGVPVIVGGIYATLCSEHAREHIGADTVIPGPGERQFLEVLGDVTGNGCEISDEPAPRRPAYHLLRNLDSVSMLTSRGCPFSCEYCASRILQPRFSQRPVTDVVEEMAHYSTDLGISDIAFYDDALLTNADSHIKPILREVIKRGLRLRLHTPNGLHANLVDEETAMLMKRAGFATIRLSIESVNEHRLRDSCSKVSPDGFRRAVANLRAAGYAEGTLEAYVLIGAPGQRAEEVEETMRFVNREGVLVRLADFSPIPGTPYFDTAAKTYGLDLSEPLLHNSSVMPYLVSGLRDRYEALKQMARSLNRTCDRVR